MTMELKQQTGSYVTSRSMTFRIVTRVLAKDSGEYAKALIRGAEIAAASIKEQFGFEVRPVSMLAVHTRRVSKTPISVTYEFAYTVMIEY